MLFHAGEFTRTRIMKEYPQAMTNRAQSMTVTTTLAAQSVHGLPARYGRALYDLATEKKAVATLIKEADVLKSLLTEELLDVLANPVLPRTRKDALVQAVVEKAGLSSWMAGFARLVVRAGRGAYLPQMLEAALAYEAADRADVPATVVSAQPLTATQKKEIETFVKGLGTGIKSVTLREQVDPSLLAGMKVRVGSTEIDLSTKGRLQQLRRALATEQTA